MSRNPSDATIKAWTRLIRARDRVLGAIEQDLEAGDCPPLAWYDVLLELTRAPTGGCGRSRSSGRRCLRSTICRACSTGSKRKGWSRASRARTMPVASGW